VYLKYQVIKYYVDVRTVTYIVNHAVIYFLIIAVVGDRQLILRTEEQFLTINSQKQNTRTVRTRAPRKIGF
jgi:hypothetical protein